MTQQHTPLRSGMTAIAAVLALSSTAAFAQAADQTVAEPSAPVIAAPPPPVADAPTAVAPAEAATPTPAPMTATPEVAPAAPAVAATAAPMATRSTPVIHTPEAAAAERASNAPKRATATTRTTATSRSSITTRSATPPAAAPQSAAVAPAPVANPAPVLKPVTPAAPATVATTRTSTQTASDNTLPIAAGAIGLGIIALGAGAYMFARRRRDDEDEVIAEPTEGTIVAPVTAPVYAVAPEAVTAVPGTPVLAREEDEPMTLANGFDLSHFGRHARAAYRGPTPDNPSHSLKRRLARASFFDQREREAIVNGTAPAEAMPIAARTARAPVTALDNDQVVIRPGYRRPSRFFGTAFQR